MSDSIPAVSLDEQRAKKHAYYMAHKAVWKTTYRSNRIDKLGPDAERLDALARGKRYRDRNQDRLAPHRRKMYAANRERYLAYAKKYRDANREKIRAYGRARYWSDPVKHRAEVMASAKRHPKPFYGTRMGVNTLYANRRRALRAGNGGAHTEQEWQEKLDLFARCCAYCGESRPLTRDHKVPLSRGGTDDIMNIIPACRSCNSKKRALTATEFIAARAA